MYENLRDLDLLPTKVLNLLISKGSFATLGFLAGLSLFIEDPRRRAELAMYVLPKSLESAWSSARGKGYVMRTGELGDALVSDISTDHYTCTRASLTHFSYSLQLTAIGMGMIMVSASQPSTTTRLTTVLRPSFSFSIRGHTSTIRTTCRVLLDAFCISLLAQTNTPCACACSWGQFFIYPVPVKHEEISWKSDVRCTVYACEGNV